MPSFFRVTWTDAGRRRLLPSRRLGLPAPRVDLAKRWRLLADAFRPHAAAWQAGLASSSEAVAPLVNAIAGEMSADAPPAALVAGREAARAVVLGASTPDLRLHDRELTTLPHHWKADDVGLALM